MNKEENSNNITKQKKISYFSAILVVMGSSIGAGIFFKSSAVLDNSQNSFILAIFCWIIAAFSVVAMALSLIEVASKRNDNLSVIGWTKVFNSRTTFKACKNFMFYIYLPLTYFFMPLYVIMSLQDGLSALIHNNNQGATFGTSVDWLLWTLISLSLSTYFIFISGLSSKIGNVQNKIITYIKFLPLVLVTLIGFILVGMNAGGWDGVSMSPQKPTIDLKDESQTINDSIEAGLSVLKFAPGLGMFMAISAIFFAYDGFYVVAGLQSEMKEPKKTPQVILFGLLFTTVIYLIIAISMSINGGNFFDMSSYMIEKWGRTGAILFGLINLAIAIGVMGILNGFSMWAPRFVEDLIKEGELPFSIKFKNKLNEEKPKIGVMYCVAISTPIVIIFTLIGSLAYIDQSGYGDLYGSGMNKLYSFADLMGTWTSLFAFSFITASIYGCLKEKIKLKEKTNNKFFKPLSIVAIVIISFAFFVTVIQPILDVFLIAQLDKELISAVNRSYVEIVISRVMLLVTLILFAMLSYGITILEDLLNIKKFGSLENYEKWQKQNFIVS